MHLRNQAAGGFVRLVLPPRQRTSQGVPAAHHRHHGESTGGRPVRGGKGPPAAVARADRVPEGGENSGDAAFGSAEAVPADGGDA